MIDGFRQRASFSGVELRSDDVHRGQPLLTAGPAVENAAAVAILLHGRGGAAWDMLNLAEALTSKPVAFLAPRAAGRTWYPERFLAPLAANEPALSSALAVVRELIDRVLALGTPQDRIVIGGFSQGACLALEAAARRGGRFGGLFGFSGALIGPPGGSRPADRPLDGTPVFLGCSEDDAHIPLDSFREAARTLRALGAEVAERVYPGSAHTVFDDELARVRGMIDGLFEPG